MAFGIVRRGNEPRCGTCVCFDRGTRNPDGSDTFLCKEQSNKKRERDWVYVSPNDLPQIRKASWDCHTPRWIITLVYDFLKNNACEEEIPLLEYEQRKLDNFFINFLSRINLGFSAEYSYLGFLIAQYIRSLTCVEALEIAKFIRETFFKPILDSSNSVEEVHDKYSDEYTSKYSLEGAMQGVDGIANFEDCKKFINMYEYYKSIFNINSAMEGLLYDDNALPIPVDPSKFMPSSEEQQETTIVGINQAFALMPLNKQKS